MHILQENDEIETVTEIKVRLVFLRIGVCRDSLPRTANATERSSR